jgi:hypothetical protein
MTILGPDVSSFQDGLDLGATPYPFAIMKISEGTYYTDKDYPGWRAQAVASGKLPIGYHFISGEDPAAQARHLAACIGDRSIPLMLDFEPTATYRPDLPQLIAVADEIDAAGMRVHLAYVPRWYWQQIGSPTLTSLSARGIALVASAYPGGTGYPGDSAPGWLPYGGLTPLLYQYTDHAPVGGKAVDMNAFRGTIAQLAEQLGLTTTPTTGGIPMGSIPPSIAAKWPDIAGELPPNGTYDDSTAIIWADGGARAAALYALQARDAIRALDAKYSAPPPVDVDALAAALAPKLAVGATADEIAHAVVVHLGAVLVAPTAG